MKWPERIPQFLLYHIGGRLKHVRVVGEIKYVALEPRLLVRIDHVTRERVHWCDGGWYRLSRL